MSEEHQKPENTKENLESGTFLSNLGTAGKMLAVAALVMTEVACTTAPPLPQNRIPELEGNTPPTPELIQMTNAERAGAVNPEDAEFYRWQVEQAKSGRFDQYAEENVNPRGNRTLLELGQDMFEFSKDFLQNGIPSSSDKEKFQTGVVVDENFSPDVPMDGKGGGQRVYVINDGPPMVFPGEVKRDSTINTIRTSNKRTGGYGGSYENVRKTVRETAEIKADKIREIPFNEIAKEYDAYVAKFQKAEARNNIPDGKDGQPGFGAASLFDSSGKEHIVTVRSDGENGTPDKVGLNGKDFATVDIIGDIEPKDVAAQVARELQKRGTKAIDDLVEKVEKTDIPENDLESLGISRNGGFTSRGTGRGR